eukprot:5254112-Amphidinium_carterae.1
MQHRNKRNLKHTRTNYSKVITPFPKQNTVQFFGGWRSISSESESSCTGLLLLRKLRLSADLQRAVGVELERDDHQRTLVVAEKFWKDTVKFLRTVCCPCFAEPHELRRNKNGYWHKSSGALHVKATGPRRPLSTSVCMVMVLIWGNYSF